MVGFFYAHTDMEHKKDIGVDDLPDLDDAPLKFKNGKDLLLDWALRDCPSFMRRFHNWYKRACILGLKTIYAPHPPDAFGVKEQQVFDITLDFEDLQHIFCLQKLGVEMVQLWCM